MNAEVNRHLSDPTNGLDKDTKEDQNTTIPKRSGVNTMGPMFEFALCFAGLILGLVASFHIHTEMIIKRMRNRIKNNPEAIFGELEI